MRAAALLVGALACGAFAPALGAVFEDRPDALVCSVSDPTGVLRWDELVFWVSARMREGDTLYKTLTSDPVVLVVDAEGRIRGRNLADCDGRTVDELRAEGRAIDLTAR
jgi:hypothetical protein